MKIYKILLLVLLFNACLPIPQVIDGVEVRGEVLDNSTARPLAGASVQLSCSQKVGRKKAVTDSNGKFKVAWGSHLKLYRSLLTSKEERVKRKFEGKFKKEGYEGEILEDSFTPRNDMKYIDFGVVYLEPKR